MISLETEISGQTLEGWLVATGTGLAALLVLLTFKGRVGKIAARAGGDKFGRLLEGILNRTRFLFLLYLAVFAGSLTLDLSQAAQTLLRQILVLVVLAQVGIWGNLLISFWVEGTAKVKKETDAARTAGIGAVTFVLRLALWSAIILLFLDNLGFDITTLVAGLGVGGIAVALALQNILSDLFASLTISLDKPFEVGDFIIVGDHMGTVEHVGLKNSRLRSLGGEQLILANSDLLQSRIRNYKRMRERRIQFLFGVVYQTDPDKLQAIPQMVQEIIQSQESVRFDRAHFKEYGDSDLKFEVVYYLLTPDYNRYMDIQQNINLALFQKFRDEKIEFAYPTQTLHVRAETEKD